MKKLQRVYHRIKYYAGGIAIGNPEKEDCIIRTDSGEIFRKGGLPWEATGAEADVPAEAIMLIECIARIEEGSLAATPQRKRTLYDEVSRLMMDFKAGAVSINAQMPILSN